METAPNSPPPTHGFYTDGECVDGIDEYVARGTQHAAAKNKETRRASRTRQSYSKNGEDFVPVQLEAAARRPQFRKRANTDPLAPVPEHAELPRQESLN
jgi:hypothetical protein